MPSIILSDNGVSSGSAGLKSTAASDGALALQTTTAGGTATTAVTIDTSQNVGLGTASPSLKLTIAGAMNLTNSSRAGAFEITSGGDLWTGTATTAGNIIFETGHTTSGLPSTGTERVKINQYGIGLGATTPSSGMGITFPASQSASSNANTLDDYEEGTWTPVLRGLSVAGTVSGGSVVGTYTKIGRVVTVFAKFSEITMTGASGNIQVTGLPFTSIDPGSAVYNPVAIPAWKNFSVATNTVPCVYLPASSTYVNGLLSIANGSQNVWVDWNISNGNPLGFFFTLTYEAV